MNKTLASLMTAAAVLGTAAAANADIVSGTITADNHYALFTSTGNVFSYHGGNELGYDGNPGSYNWSLAESYQFPAGDYLYIAAWSDDAVAQGVLAEFRSDALGDVLSGDPRWQVYGTGINLGDGDPHPSILDIATYVGYAESNQLWETPFVGGNNGVAPWSTISGISGEARWMWQQVAGDLDPLNGGSGAGEMLIFRVGASSIPTPGAIALLGVGGLMAMRRRR